MKIPTVLVAVLAMLALLATACGGDEPPAATDDTVDGDGDRDDATSSTTDDVDTTDTTEAEERPTIRIGVQDFGESALLAEIYGQVLEAADYPVEYVELGGFRDVLLTAFNEDEVDFSPEYAASLLEFLNGEAGTATGDIGETSALLQDQLDAMELVALEPAPAVDTHAFVVTRETSLGKGLARISDLPADGGDLRLGAPQDCETDRFCLPGLQRVYGIDLSSGFVPLEAARVAPALAADEVQIGVLFSTSGRIAAEDWVLLEDDRNMLAADNVTPVIRRAVADAYGDDLTDLVRSVSVVIDTETLTALNERTSIDGEAPDAVAADFIAEAGLGAPEA